ncbi:hypothetical protein DFH08DRAFT_825876 [Mycena albidolilacea]|uniref:Uncharacterized protein n=1 Tax=Mycena albidolilacea TaxID=1033008 RepID=A0AAD6Z106_9AGAR|nr:hypothetical protein DFH08DRAFT_825876 [Mycena albidolilacea]
MAVVGRRGMACGVVWLVLAYTRPSHLKTFPSTPSSLLVLRFVLWYRSKHILLRVSRLAWQNGLRPLAELESGVAGGRDVACDCPVVAVTLNTYAFSIICHAVSAGIDHFGTWRVAASNRLSTLDYLKEANLTGCSVNVVNLLDKSASTIVPPRK